VAPPAKRRKADAGVFEDVLLNTKGGKKIAQAHTTRVNGAGSARVKEGNVTVSTANGHGDVVDAGSRKGKKELVEISSDESSDLGESEEDEEDEEEEVEEALAIAGKVNGATNGVAQSDEEGEEDTTARENPDPMDEDEDEEATFGERLYAQTSEPIDVEGALARAESFNVPQNQPSAAIARAPAGATFSTVLSQALRTNDNALMEVCFNTSDLEGVRETLSRLDSRLVIPLLQRIAERISKSPGRLGNLMVWVQWGVIAHGGYFVHQSDFWKQLQSLHRVISERAQGLGPLLQLKGKLDMLAAQFDLRREELERHVREEEDEEEGVYIYVEGQSEGEDEGSDEDALYADQRRLLDGLAEEDGGSEEEAVGTGAFANGVVRGDVETSDSEDGEDGFIDDEASESDGSEEDEEDEDSDDEDDE
jgi:U3 small nucleolar RNA-associated protein 5